MIPHRSRRVRARGAGSLLALAITVAGTVGAASLLPSRPALAATVTLQIQPEDVLVGCPTGYGAGGSLLQPFCAGPTSLDAVAGDTLTVVNNDGQPHTITTSVPGARSFTVAAHGSRSLSLSPAGSYSYAVDGVQGTISVAPGTSGPAAASPTPGAGSGAGGSASTTSPSGSGRGGPTTVRAHSLPTVKQGPSPLLGSAGPAGSDALPPVDPSAAVATPDSSLPPITPASPTPRASALATTPASTGLSRSAALYLTGALLFLAVALTAGGVIGLRRWRRHRAATSAPDAV